MQRIDPLESRAPPPLPEGFELLNELAVDLRSAWNHAADELWDAIDPQLWRETGNAWLVLQSAPHARLRELLGTPSFRQRVEVLQRERLLHKSAAGWFQRAHPTAPVSSVAFFSLEFALSEGLPLYSGGLGNVAGDYLKAASDLSVPLVGVGLLYQQGYFRQTIDARGAQREFYPFNDTSQLPVVPVRNRSGDWVRVLLPVPGPPVWLRGWAARVGRLRLYLLDSNDPMNTPTDRGITAQLYGGGSEMRLLQEMALGIGGWRLLRAIGLHPEVCHLNEGHAGLAPIERARDYMHERGQPFDVALAATRAGNLFTTHTPVEAGFDRFSPELVGSYMGSYIKEELGLSLDEWLALGRIRPHDPSEPLSMAWLALRGSGAVNGVSRRHGEVSRRLFQALFPRWPEREVPVGYVTNGVHVPSWDSNEADALWSKACGQGCWRDTMQHVGEDIAKCADAELWAFRTETCARLVDFVRKRLSRQLAAAGVRGEPLEAADRVLDPDALTIGMARRFATYKRPTLLLHDQERFARLLTDRGRPVQVIVAGKAHPRDEEGKALVQAWLHFARRAEVRPHVVFLADYDLRLAERLVQGVDLWVNTPRPPWEACGTSGMKVLVNGGINLSALDGWWAEAYQPDVGWALPGDGRDDDADAARLYDVLEREVIPAFYERDASGVPHAWVSRMRASMGTLTPLYSANRAVREYTERYYVALAERFARRDADGGALARRIVASERTMREHGPMLHFGEIGVRTDGGRHRFALPVYLNALDPSTVAVELFADGRDGGDPVRIPMTREAPLVGARGFVYTGDTPDDRPSADYTPRAIASHSDAAVPLEAPFIAWAR